MDGFFEVELNTCEHVLVKILKLTHKCCKCKQLKWPWSKAVGCIKCMKVWHRRCQPIKSEVNERVVEPCTVETTAIVNAEENNSIVGIARAVGKFLKHPFRRIHHKMGRGRTAGVALELSGQPLMKASLDCAPTITQPVKLPETKNAGDTWAIITDVQSLTVYPTVAPEAENIGAARAITLDAPSMLSHTNKWLITAGKGLKRLIARTTGPVAVVPVERPKLKNTVFFAKAIPDKNAVQVDVKTEKVEKTVVVTEPVIGRFSNQYYCQPSYRKITTTWTIAGALELYRRLLPEVTMNRWPLTVVLHRTIQPTIITTTVAAAKTDNFKASLAITWKPLSTADKDRVQVDVNMEKVVTSYQVNGRFSCHNQCQPSYRKVTTNWTIAGALELYRRLLPEVTMNRWPLTVVLHRTITATTTTTVLAPPTNIFEAPLVIARKPLAILPPFTVTAPLAKTVAPLAITSGRPTITSAPPAITTAPLGSPNRNLCHRLNCKNRRCRRRQNTAVKEAKSDNC
ncbi:uncharacterized protein LOC112688070 [Sipha flava]|uniref:Uncharacterized protein LOC112688070 n=2 Tax=Sipha flava TaxID=143950 RepID=A0A8B8G2J4_9HEMI|nr:uncharacterized protein LOC112688070 [Sipha flava]